MPALPITPEIPLLFSIEYHSFPLFHDLCSSDKRPNSTLCVFASSHLPFHSHSSTSDLVTSFRPPSRKCLFTKPERSLPGFVRRAAHSGSYCYPLQTQKQQSPFIPALANHALSPMQHSDAPFLWVAVPLLPTLDSFCTIIVARFAAMSTPCITLGPRLRQNKVLWGSLGGAGHPPPRQNASLIGRSEQFSRRMNSTGEVTLRGYRSRVRGDLQLESGGATCRKPAQRIYLGRFVEKLRLMRPSL